MTSAQEESARRYPPDRGEVRLSAGSMRNARREAFEKGAAWQAEQPVEITDEMVERAAHAMFEEPGVITDDGYTWAEMVVEDSTRADIWRADARRVLLATLHTNGSEG